MEPVRRGHRLSSPHGPLRGQLLSYFVMIRRHSRTQLSCEELQAKRQRAGASPSEAPLTVTTAGQRAIELLNRGDLQSFRQLLDVMGKQGIRTLDLSHDPDRRGSPKEPPLINELAMECLATVFERSEGKAVSAIRALDFSGAHVANFEPFLKVLEETNGRALRRLDFSGARVRKGERLYPLQAKHFQRIAQLVANARHLQSLALNDQPLLRGQKPGAVLELPVQLVHLQCYVPEPADTEVPSSLPELVNAVCFASAARGFQSLQLRGCNLSDDDLATLWPIIDTSAPIDLKGVPFRQQLAHLDLRSNPIMSYGNRLMTLAKALSPTGALQHLSLPSQFKHVYRQLYEHDRKQFNECVVASQLQVLEPFTSAEEPEFNEVKEPLESRRFVIDVVVHQVPESPMTHPVQQNLDPSIYA